MSLKAILFLSLLLAVIAYPTTVDGEPVCPKSSTFGRGSFPDDFLFGAATSAFQHEGGEKEGGRGLSIWDSFTLKHSDDGKLGVDFYNHYKEDVQLLKKLNMDAFRFSISWSRIFPHGKKDKGVSQTGVQFYNDLINELIANGVTPMVTLFHWDVPQALEDEYGGFLSDRIVEDFREFAKFAFNEYGDRVKHWVTINEPYEFSIGGYDNGEKAPGRCSNYVNEKCHEGKSGHEVYIVSHNLLLAHAEAVEEFRKCGKCKEGKIGIIQSPMWFEPYDKKSSSSEEIVKRAMDFTLGWFIDPIIHGDYPQIMKDTVGARLLSFTSDQKEKLKGSYDFVGINYFTSAFVAHVDTVDPEKPSWEADSGLQFHSVNPDGFKIGSQPANAKYPVCADGLRKVLKYIKENYNDPEVIVTGNGYKETLEEKDVLPDALSDNNRKYYHMRHLMALHGAVCEDKVNVKGYFVWSLMDGLEWEDGYKTRSGLYYVDYTDNLVRHEKQSAKWLSKLLEIVPDTIQSKGDSESSKEL